MDHKKDYPLPGMYRTPTNAAIGITALMLLGLMSWGVVGLTVYVLYKLIRMTIG